MEIRPATPEDAGTISELILRLTHYFTLDPDGKGAETFLETISPEGIAGFIKAPDFQYLAGIIDGKIAGVVAIRDNRHLYHLFVAPVFHRQGLAKELWEHAMRESLVRGNPGEFTVNSTLYAVPVYASFGFEVVGEKIETNGIAFVPMKFTLKLDARLS
jgi:GNAT superfamily N-acetyltransferase